MIMKVNVLIEILAGIKNKEQDFVVQFKDPGNVKRTLEGPFYIIEVVDANNLDKVALRVG